ncbi:unnamed protein product [Amoebophrya sp. A120]|nr:unnamed protein product [Amoebophrya sp. A120]|eukprot:GSA120T00024121001.1
MKTEVLPTLMKTEFAKFWKSVWTKAVPRGALGICADTALKSAPTSLGAFPVLPNFCADAAVLQEQCYAFFLFRSGVEAALRAYLEGFRSEHPERGVEEEDVTEIMEHWKSEYQPEGGHFLDARQGREQGNVDAGGAPDSSASSTSSSGDGKRFAQCIAGHMLSENERQKRALALSLRKHQQRDMLQLRRLFSESDDLSRATELNTNDRITRPRQPPPTGMEECKAALEECNLCWVYFARKWMWDCAPFGYVSLLDPWLSARERSLEPEVYHEHWRHNRPMLRQTSLSAGGIFHMHLDQKLAVVDPCGWRLVELINAETRHLHTVISNMDDEMYKGMKGRGEVEFKDGPGSSWSYDSAYLSTNVDNGL